jgi:hypothetical protein
VNRPGRYLIAILLSVVVAVSAFPLDVNENRVVVLDYPGMDEADFAFLRKLVNYLGSAEEPMEEKFEIEITGLLPSIASDGKIDFQLTSTDKDRRGVLYRHAALASYKRAAVSIKQFGGSSIPDAESVKIVEYNHGFRVEKGQIVKVMLVSGMVRVEVDGETMQAGAGSDQIRVMIRETGKEFVGTIVGPLEVNVVL